MFIKAIEFTLKYTAISLLIAYLTFTHSRQIEHSLNNLRFHFADSEKGFVPKEQALDMSITYEMNSKNNLETYVRSYNQRLPVYARQNGIIIGDPSHTFSNLTPEEKRSLCAPDPKDKPIAKNHANKKRKNWKDFFYSLYKAWDRREKHNE